jgi:RNA polymerase sigma-70 factor (ECF subfamily)
VTLHERIDQLYNEARDDVYYYVLTLGLSPGQAQDVAQEVFLRLFSAMTAGQTIENPRGWIFRVAHNLGLKLRVKERRTGELSPELESILGQGGDNPESAVIRDERSARLARAVADLSPQQRQVLHLRAEGLRYQEIADTLGIGTSTVGEFLRRALARLKKALHE